MGRAAGLSRVNQPSTATGEGRGDMVETAVQSYDRTGPNSSERLVPNEPTSPVDPRHCQLNLATCNVRSMTNDDKSLNVKIEFERLKLDVMGISEMR